ncbi:expressed unknown protein [Seminavis robusta]|uniref:Calcineurin-like phosphoesterase domain-containing protein n=1 Tax=Seminavis robusta TaxID=568900 RepID=A0A9N8DJR2_9STRA|nr:expressed unknown protein [Seminavis robusta]|eukprot:Sro97_g049980.1 n/a (396) ;mRNA; f:55726-56913
MTEQPPKNEKVHSYNLYDLRKQEEGQHRIRHPPSVHIARGFEPRLPILKATRRPIICISDWQYETATQEHFWEQAKVILSDHLGGQEILSRAIVFVAGDMASSDNSLRGTASDAVPRLHWLRETFPKGDLFQIYGNHDLMDQEHLIMANTASSGAPCLLPHGNVIRISLVSGVANEPTSEQCAIDHNANITGEAIVNASPLTNFEASPQASAAKTPNVQITPGMTKQERAALYAKMKFPKKAKPSKKSAQDKQWRHQNPDQAALVDAMKVRHNNHTSSPSGSTHGNLVLAGVHGIPSSHNQGMQKSDRPSYFRTLGLACETVDLDVLVTHSNPRLPGQEDLVKGDDARKMLEAFEQSSAYLFVHGHMHVDPAVSVLDSGKVVVNSDCRVVAFVPN